MKKYISSSYRILKDEGVALFAKKVYEKIFKKNLSYDEWFQFNLPQKQEIDRQRKYQFRYMPLISIIVPVYNTPINFLYDMIHSVQKQTYSKWELCIANGSKDNPELLKALETIRDKDDRIKVKTLDNNEGIAGNTNEALSFAKGDYIALLDHDDVLNEEALFRIVEAMQPSGIDVLYSDEDFLSGDGKTHIFPILKPDYSEELLCSHNYITHFFVVKKEIVDDIGGFSSKYDGSQDYDLIFKCIEKAKNIKHVPYILYHWRMHEASVAGDPNSKQYAYDAGKRAIEDHLKRIDADAEIGFISGLHGMYHSRFQIVGNPKLSVIIAENNLPICFEEVSRIIDCYSNIEIIVIGKPQSGMPDLRNAKCAFKQIEVPDDLSVAAKYNRGADAADGEYLLFLNSGLTPVNGDAIKELLGCCCRKDVGVVGTKILTPDNLIYHAGIVLGGKKGVNYPFQGIDNFSDGYLQRPRINCNYSAVSGKALLTSKQIFKQVNGFDDRLDDSLYDVAFCMKARKRKMRVVYCAHSQWKYAKDPKLSPRRSRMNRYNKKYLLRLSHYSDPFYNPNFEDASDIFAVSFKK
ncbi:MAG: glycosyltransferase family 2 protein [Merdimonas faecis]|uniref:glycosyltransferase family 2 protein n=1 Tax=Merdimonas faecis TaxID=1653435 RepID=UPI0039905F3B